MDLTAAYLARALEDAMFALAARISATVADIRWDLEVSGGEYTDDAAIVLGADVWDLLEWCAEGAPDEAWWDVARIGAHEVLHGRRPRAAGAFEEAIVETLARAEVPRMLDALPGAPFAPPADYWATSGAPYAPQVRWLERLASWLGLEPVRLAEALKDGRSGPRAPERALARLIGTVANDRLRLGLGRVRIERLGAQIAASAGVINAGAHVRPRSPVRAAERALTRAR